MKTIRFYIIGFFVWIWFLISFFTGLLLLPFFWKKVGITKIVGNILYFGGTRILGFKSIIEGSENLYSASPCIYACNHQSNFDIITMSNLYPRNTAIIGKKELIWVPIFGLFFYGAGHVLLDRKNRKSSVESLNDAANETRRRRISLWIFPEGTRNKGAKKLLPFKKGPFHLAIQAQLPIVPIINQHLSTYFNPSEKLLFGNSTKIISKVLPAISTTGMTSADVDKLLQQVRTEMEKALDDLNKRTGVNF